MVDDAGFMNFRPQLGLWVSKKYSCLIKKFQGLDVNQINNENKRKFLKMAFECDIITIIQNASLHKENSI